MAKKRKIQKVRFHKGDRRPDNLQPTLSYVKRMKKHNKDIIWEIIEKPTNNVIAQYFFEEDAFRTMKFQNKHRVWEPNGGVPKFLWVRV